VQPAIRNVSIPQEWIELADSTEVLIGELDGQRILIQPYGRRQSGLFDNWDDNWISCDVQVSAGGFRGSFRASFRWEDFQGLLDEIHSLSQTLEGTASFSTLEGQIEFSLTGDGKGHVRVQGVAQDQPGGNRLHFEFEIDQTYLPPISAALEHLLAVFPIAGTPDPAADRAS
jgi:hypothetical protein